MSTPEIISEQPVQPEMTPRVEQPIVPETAQQLGVTAPPQAPKPIAAPDNPVVVQPVSITPLPDETPSLTVPTNIALSEKELEKGATGPSNLAVTWLDMYWLREVGRAFSKGWKVIFGAK